MEKMTAKEFREMWKNSPNPNKYGNRRTKIDGFDFDSEKEAGRYAELKMLEKAGAISDLRLQVPFELQPDFYHNGEKIQKIKYVADFVYMQDGKQVIEDVKSDGTRNNQIYKLKKKMMLYHGWEIKEI